MNKRAHPPVVIQMGNAQRWTRRVRAGMTEDAQSLEEVGTPGHSVCTQLDHPHKNESLHHGSPLSEFMSTYHAQELSTFTLDFTPGFWAQLYCAQLFPMASFLLSEEKESPLPEKKLENCPCIISLSLARVTLMHTMPPIVHSKPRTGRLPRAACLTPVPTRLLESLTSTLTPPGPGVSSNKAFLSGVCLPATSLQFRENFRQFT